MDYYHLALHFFLNEYMIKPIMPANNKKNSPAVSAVSLFPVLMYWFILPIKPKAKKIISTTTITIAISAPQPPLHPESLLLIFSFL